MECDCVIEAIAKIRSHLQILGIRKVTGSVLRTDNSVSLTYLCELKHILICKERGEGCSYFAENIRHNHTKFSCPDDQASGICEPLVYCKFSVLITTRIPNMAYYYLLFF